MSKQILPRVGVGLLIIREGKILLGKRKASHGKNEFNSTGGHLEMMESFEECVLRELAEEAGPDLKVQNIRFLCVTNLTKYAPKHYVDIGMVAEWESGEAIVAEPDQLELWNWYAIDDLPEPLFVFTPNYVEAYKTGRTYFSKNND